MIDIHTHILPGFDDGAEDETMAWRTVMRSVYEESVSAMFVTPHSDAFDLYPDRFPQLLDRLRKKVPDVPFYPGCEVMCEPSRMGEILENLERKIYPDMNGTGYVLAEFYHSAEPEQILPCLEALIRRGWKPILAHVERYENLQYRQDVLEQIRSLGVLLQVNTCSLSQLDEENPNTLSWARKLAAEKKVTFLGTDTHGLMKRPPVVCRAMEWLTAACTPEYLAAITGGNAERLLLRK